MKALVILLSLLFFGLANCIDILPNVTEAQPIQTVTPITVETSTSLEISNETTTTEKPKLKGIFDFFGDLFGDDSYEEDSSEEYNHESYTPEPRKKVYY